MRTDVQDKLLELNGRFYNEFGQAFSSTRQRLQPGVIKVASRLTGQESLLDLGCGNGQLARWLVGRGHRGSYLGLDSSPSLLAETGLLSKNMPVRFTQADLASPDWDASLPRNSFQRVFAFAVLHHLPGEILRILLLSKVKTLLAAGGQFIHSNWQFLDSPRLKNHILSWQSLGFNPGDLDDGDYLLDWRQGGQGLRYVHHFNPVELASLAQESGFSVSETFLSDGEGGRLGLYQVWEVK